MKLVLNQDGVKREIVAPFEMAINKADAQRLVEILNEQLREDKNFCYGWITVFEVPSVEAVPNTQPLPWK